MARRRNRSPKDLIIKINTEYTGSGVDTITNEYGWSTRLYNRPGESNYDFWVDWGDNTRTRYVNTTNASYISHSYANKGEYIITFSGHIPSFRPDDADPWKWLQIIQHGDWYTTVDRAFRNCINLTDFGRQPNILSPVGTNPNSTFQGCTNFNGLITRLQPPGDGDFSYMFHGATNFNQPVNHWDMSSATNIRNFLSDCVDFNQPVNQWDVSNVTTVYELFSTTKFNQPLHTWKLTSCKDFYRMFEACSTFDQDLSAWSSSFQASNIDFDAVFRSCLSFNNGGSPNINDWDTSNFRNINGLFSTCFSFNQPVGNWDVSNITIFANTFSDAISFNQNVNSWNVSKATTMQSMFRSDYYQSSSFNQPLDTWTPVSCSNFTYMFKGAHVFNQNLSSWSSSFQASNIDMSYMFLDAVSFDQSLGKWEIANITNMTSMLNDCGMSRLNYEDTLISWSLQAPNIQSSVPLGASGLQYSGSNSQVSASRAVLINDYGWTISGDINVG